MFPFTTMHEAELRKAHNKVLEGHGEIEDVIQDMRDRMMKASDPFMESKGAMIDAIETELIRGERIRMGHDIDIWSDFRRRYYHPTKGWRLSRAQRREIKKRGIVLA